MEIVIKIDEEKYKDIKNDVKKFLSMPVHNVPYLYEVINEGAPLPKGHGKLIDADKTLKNAEKIYNAPNIKDIINPAQMYAIRKILTTAPTIIEADKENG